MKKKLVNAFYLREQAKKEGRTFRLGIFDGDGGSGGDGGDGGDGSSGDDGGDDDDDDDPKTYTVDEVNNLIKKKKAEWEKQQKKQQDKNKRNSDERIADLEKELEAMKSEKAHNELMSTARTALQEAKVNVPDTIISHLVGEDADATEENVKEFIKVYQDAVSEGVKAALKGNDPKKGGSSKMTKEEIMKVENRAERQKLIRENPDLFK